MRHALRVICLLMFLVLGAIAEAQPVFYADAQGGSDEGDGSQARPWRTLNHALTRLTPGSTLQLSGTFYERVHCALAGPPDQPITIKGAADRPTVIDGGFREFFESPADAWVPFPDGAPGEFRSAKTYRNIVDMRKGVRWIRPTEEKPEGALRSGQAFFMHGSDHAKYVESAYAYQNTIVAPTHGGRAFGQGTLYHTKPDTIRRVFNNIFVYDPATRYVRPFYGTGVKDADIQVDGNLHWVPDPEAKPPGNLIEQLRTHPLSQHNIKNYPAGFGSRSLVGDPKFVRYESDPAEPWDLHLRPRSPAVDAGVALPDDWPDPLREDDGKPDIGAIPAEGADADR